MTHVYVKRGAVVEAEPFDPSRDDQGVSVRRPEDAPEDAAPGGDPPPVLLSATMRVGGRAVDVCVGDWIVQDPRGPYPVGGIAFSALFQPLEEVVAPALEETAPTTVEGGA